MVTTRPNPVNLSEIRLPPSAVHYRPWAPIWTLAVLVLLALSPICVANAQEFPGDEPADTAGNRAQPGYDATGVTLGSFRIYPVLGITAAYDSNVFARETGAQGDAAATLVPSVRAEWSRPGKLVTLDGDVRIRRYAQLTRQNDEQYRVESSLALELLHDTRVTGDAGWARSTVGRGTFENGLQIGSPLRQERLWSQLSIQHRLNRLYIGAGVSAERFRYSDVVLDDGTTIDQDFRDGRRIGGQLSAGYQIGPRLSIVARGTLDRYEYPNARPELVRDATGYSAIIGVRYELTQLLVAELGAGIRKHDFDDPAIGDISGLAPSAQLRWYPTPLLSVRFDLSRSTTTSAFDTIAAVAVTRGQLSADYELRRNLVLTAGADVSHEAYGPGNGASSLQSISGQAAWKPNRFLRVTGRVVYDRRKSSGLSPIPEFDALRVMLTVAAAR